MKKILFTTAIIGLLFAGCDKDPNDPNGDEVKKLPSKMRWDYVGYEEIHGYQFQPLNWQFEYDDQNRLVMYDHAFGEGPYSKTAIIYDEDGNPIRIGAGVEGSTFQYGDNQVLVSSDDGYYVEKDTLTINANGQLVSWSSNYNYHHRTRNFTYNSNGNVIGIHENREEEEDYIETFTYSDVRAIWRYVNVPDWFWMYAFVSSSYNLFVGGTKGYMVSSAASGGRCSYRLDADGYVRQVDVIGERRNNSTGELEATGSVLVVTFEYIPAK